MVVLEDLATVFATGLGADGALPPPTDPLGCTPVFLIPNQLVIFQFDGPLSPPLAVPGLVALPASGLRVTVLVFLGGCPLASARLTGRLRAFRLFRRSLFTQRTAVSLFRHRVLSVLH